METIDQATLGDFLARHRYGVVSSVSEADQPQSALVGIAVTPELEIVFDTVTSSRKYANLTARPACSLVVGWAGEQTAQFEGLARELAGVEADVLKEQYFAVWPESRAHLVWPDIAYFAVSPIWIRYSDYERRPPLIQEFTFRS